VARYSILIKPSAVKEIESIQLKRDRQRIVERIRDLAENPRPPGCEKLSGRDKYRLRQGRYRILYSIEDADLLVYVVKVAHRKDVYRQK
jgi:mRNA interferase RelE/StbE